MHFYNQIFVPKLEFPFFFYYFDQFVWGLSGTSTNVMSDKKNLIRFHPVITSVKL